MPRQLPLTTCADSDYKDTWQKRALGWFLYALLAVLISMSAWAADTSWQKYYESGEKAYEQGRYAEAEKQLKAALKEAEKLGLQNIRVAASLNILAGVYVAQGRHTEAAPLLQRALTILKRP